MPRVLAAADFQQPTAADCEPATAHEDMAGVALATEVRGHMKVRQMCQTEVREVRGQMKVRQSFLHRPEDI